MATGESVADLVPGDSSIRLVHLQAPALRIGELRNWGCELAAGELIAHWDDDDWSAPERLSDQIARLRDSGKQVTGYRSMVFTDGSAAWIYRGPKGFGIGTSLLYQKSWWSGNRFSPDQIGEDVNFSRTADRQRQLSVADAGSLMWASVHNGNTSPRQQRTKQWQAVPIPSWVRWPAS